MIKFLCSGCQKKLGVPEEYAGKLVKCPRCGQPTRAPELEGILIADDGQDSPFSDLLADGGVASPAGRAPGAIDSPEAPRGAGAEAAAWPAAQQTQKVLVMPQGFKNPALLTNILRVLLVLGALYPLVSLWSDWREYQLLQEFARYEGEITVEMEAAAEANDQRQQKVGYIGMAIFVVYGICFLIWVHRANVNASVLSDEAMEFSPGWAVGWFFVPIANLWKPFHVVKEIYFRSRPPDASAVPSNPTLVGAWWALWLTDGFLGQLAFRMNMNAEELDVLIRASKVGMLSDVMGIPEGIVALVLVSRICAMQIARVSRDV